MSSALEIAIPALCAWRENRSGQGAGMQSVLNVLVNRAAKRGTTPYEEAIRAFQFSSMTAPGDPELILFPLPGDPQMGMALDMAGQAVQGDLPDITGGATFYYAQSMRTPPTWAGQMTQTATIANQVFFKENA